MLLCLFLNVVCVVLLLGLSVCDLVVWLDLVGVWLFGLLLLCCV